MRQAVVAVHGLRLGGCARFRHQAGPSQLLEHAAQTGGGAASDRRHKQLRSRELSPEAHHSKERPAGGSALAPSLQAAHSSDLLSHVNMLQQSSSRSLDRAPGPRPAAPRVVIATRGAPAARTYAPQHQGEAGPAGEQAPHQQAPPQLTRRAALSALAAGPALLAGLPAGAVQGLIAGRIPGAHRAAASAHPQPAAPTPTPTPPHPPTAAAASRSACVTAQSPASAAPPPCSRLPGPATLTRAHTRTRLTPPTLTHPHTPRCVGRT